MATRRKARAVGEVAIVSRVRYNHSSLLTLPAGLSLGKAFTREIEDRLYFTSEHSVLSSSLAVDIEYQNNIYKTLEQGLQQVKASTENEQEIAKQIVTGPKPRKRKGLGKRVAISDHLNNRRENVMEDLIRIKAQNPKVKLFLLSVEDKTLIEAMGGNYWACGATFRSKKVQMNQTILHSDSVNIYYPPEVSRTKYCGVGVFRREYAE